MTTCRHCAYWIPPEGKQKYGECALLGVHPINKRVMPTASIPLHLRYDGDAVEHLRTTKDYRACRGFVANGGA